MSVECPCWVTVLSIRSFGLLFSCRVLENRSGVAAAFFHRQFWSCLKVSALHVRWICYGNTSEPHFLFVLVPMVWMAIASIWTNWCSWWKMCWAGKACWQRTPWRSSPCAACSTATWFLPCNHALVRGTPSTSVKWCVPIPVVSYVRKDELNVAQLLSEQMWTALTAKL